MIVKLPAILEKVSTRQDRSYKLEYSTRELSGKEAATLLDHLQSEGWLLFSPNDTATEADIPDEKADSMTGQKTQAQRLRAVLYRLWEQKGKQGDFETYYKSSTEWLIELLKSKLEG